MKKTLVIGASENEERYAYKAVKKLQIHGHEVIAMGNKAGQIDNVKIETAKLPFENIDTVTLYINPGIQKDYYDYIISLRPKRIIFNPGTENTHFNTLAKAKGIKTEEACTLVLLASKQY